MIFPPESITRAPRSISMISPNFQTLDLHQTSNGGAGGGGGFTSSSSSKLTSSSRLNSSFLYNSRVSIALAPSALFLLSLGGIPAALILSVALVLAYFMDTFGLKPAAFFAIWFGLILSQFAFLFSPALTSLFASWPLFLLSFSLSSLSAFLVGVWISLQFRWIVMEHPSIAIALERLLFACSPIVATGIWTWAAVASVGMNNSAYYLMCFGCFFYWVFSIPRRTSFKARSENLRYSHGGEIDDVMILGPLESCLHTLALLFWPLLFRIGSHHSVMFSSSSHVADLFLLFFTPFLFQLYASNYGAMWWLTKNANQLQSMRVVNGAISMVVVVVCLEIRVVFHAFGKYLHMPPLWNYLLVTIAMLGSMLGGGAYSLGLISDAVSSTAFTAVAVVVAMAGATVIGFPLWLLPVPAVSGFFLARFFTKKSLPSYFLCVALASVTVIWFVRQNFWSLNIWLAGMSLQSLCKLLVASVFLAMTVPGFALLPQKCSFVGEVALIGHAVLICYIENQLYNNVGLYYFGFDDEVVYPSYMIILTTFLGLALIRRLSIDHRVGPKTNWVLTCLYAAKLAMLFMTSKSVVWVSALLLLAISPPVLLYKDKSRSGSRMEVWQGYVHASIVGVSAWFCRETIFEALQWWMGRPPTDGLLLGSYILLVGFASIPIVAIHFSHSQTAKRALLLLLSLGLLLILMQPPVPVSLAFRSDFIKAAHISTDDSAIYGFISAKASWPSWLLLVSIMLTLAAATTIIPIKYIVELRAVYAVGVGIIFGIYICAEYFFQATLLHALIIATVVCASVFVVFTHLPSASSPRHLPLLFALIVAIFPVAYLLEGHLRLINAPEGEVDKVTTYLALEGARVSLLGLFAAIFMLIALQIKLELASLMREKVLERGGQHSLPNKTTGFNPKYRFLQQRHASTAPTFTVKKLAAEGAWMPAIGNVATVLCFCISLVLNMHLTGGSNRSIFFLAPILLLLNQDSDMFSGFGDRQRYFPVTAVISSYLVLSSLYRVWEEVWHGDGGWGVDIGGPGWFFAVKNVALLILTFPNHILFNRFMWDFTKQSDATLLLTMPLNLPSIIISDIITVKVLGLLGVIYSLVQYLTSRQIRMAGMKYI